MGSQQFCLKWNNHQSNMLTVFEQLLSNEALVDVTLACEGLSLKAHKMVLSACSPFFQALFVENPCKHPIVILKDMRYMDLKAIVEFMYRGEVNVSQDQLSALLKTAETLKVKGLAEVTGENRQGLVPIGTTATEGDTKGTTTPRAESPPLSKRKRGRPRRRSPSDSNKSDSEDQSNAVAARVKGAPESPEIIEDGSLSSDRLAVPSPAKIAATSSKVLPTASCTTTTTAVVSTTREPVREDSMPVDDADGSPEDADFEVDASNLMEQSMTTENVPVFSDVPSSSQLVESQTHHTGSSQESSAPLIPASLPSDISISTQDIKPLPSSLIPYDEPTISPVVPAQQSTSADGSASGSLMFMDSSGVPAIAGPSNYHPDKQPSTPSHGPTAPRRRGRPPLLGLRGRPIELECPICHKTFSNKSNFDGHLTMHTAQRRRYRCDICNKSFLWRNNVYAHKRKIHNVPSSRELKLSLRSAPSLTITATSTAVGSASCSTSTSERWSQAMLPPSGFSASPSLLLLQAASAAWNETKEAEDK